MARGRLPLPELAVAGGGGKKALANPSARGGMMVGDRGEDEQDERGEGEEDCGSVLVARRTAEKKPSRGGR